MTDYRRYTFSKKEWIKEGGLALFEVLLLGILFFRSVYGCLLLLPYGFFILHDKKKEKLENRKKELRCDFKEVLLSIASSLQAGYPLEQTIAIAATDLKRTSKKENSSMLYELDRMEKSMELKITIEKIFEEFALRSGLEEIEHFSSVLSVAKRQGGNLVKITASGAEHIVRSIQVQSEIEQVLAGRKLEQKIMVWMPYFILIYLQVTNPSYLQPLYEGVGGRLFMAVCLLVTIAGRFWADSITKIRI